LTTAVPPPSSARPSEARRADPGDTSFRDTLDSASRSSEQASKEQPAQSVSSAASDRPDDDNAGDESDGGSDARGQEKPAADASSGLSLILAALAGASQAAEGTASQPVAEVVTASAGMPAQTNASAEPVEAGPWLPGQTSSDEKADAGALLALLKSSAASAAGGAETTVEVEAKVVGQETHLAMGKTSADALNKVLSDVQASAQDAATGSKATAPSLVAKAAEAALDASARARDAAVAQDAASETGTVQSFKMAADGSSAGALGDQGIAGRESGQQEARGASNSSSQPQGTNAFTASINGAASAQSRDELAGVSYEPLSDQIAAGVRAEVNADGLGETSSDGVLKVLHLELKPANLGSVTVRIELKDNAVTVHLETQRRETLAAIERERDALMTSLSAAGYKVDSITTAPQSDATRLGGLTSGSADGGAAGAQGGFQGGSNHGQGLADQSGGQGRGQSFTETPGYSGSESKDNGGSGTRRAADGIYV
jgi:flagellar hook-length control protein FliK